MVSQPKSSFRGDGGSEGARDHVCVPCWLLGPLRARALQRGTGLVPTTTSSKNGQSFPYPSRWVLLRFSFRLFLCVSLSVCALCVRARGFRRLVLPPIEPGAFSMVIIYPLLQRQMGDRPGQSNSRTPAIITSMMSVALYSMKPNRTQRTPSGPQTTKGSATFTSNKTKQNSTTTDLRRQDRYRRSRSTRCVRASVCLSASLSVCAPGCVFQSYAHSTLLLDFASVALYFASRLCFCCTLLCF